MYNLKVSENSLCMLITYVGRHLINVLKSCTMLHDMTIDDFKTINEDYLLLQYLLDAFEYDGTIDNYLHSCNVDDSYIDFLNCVMYGE